MALLLTVQSLAAGAESSPDGGWMGLDDLLKVRVVTVSRREEELFSAAAAAAVLTRDDLDEIGATSLPEALRWVPGLDVAQISTNTWAIGARGFQWQYANKLLVMIDGRSVYSPTVGGVRWEDNSTFMDDIERIEVVRGPGSSIWGANAVNGVINVVTRSAFDTLGTHLVAGTGDELQAYAGLHEGWKLTNNAALRVYADYQQSANDKQPSGLSAQDASKFGQGGFRLDWKPTAADSVTVSGDYFGQRADYVRSIATLTAPPAYAVDSTAPTTSHGADVVSDWRHEFAAGASLDWRSYWDWHYIDRPQYAESVTTVNSDLVWNSFLGAAQELTAGIGFRSISGDLAGKLLFFSPSDNETRLVNAFVQDEIALAPDRWRLTLGTKVERESATGTNVQPTVRLSYTPAPDLMFWASGARAIRTPTWSELSSDLDAAVFPPGVLDPNLPAALHINGNPRLKPETLDAFELGTRWKASRRLTVDLALFSYAYNDYVLATYTDVGYQATPPAVILDAEFENGIRGESYGGELSLKLDAADWWRLQASYSFVQIELHTKMSDPLMYEEDELTTPHHNVRLESSMRVGRDWQLILDGRYVAAVPYYAIPAYAEADARLVWRPGKRWEASLSGRNLLHSGHLEYDSAIYRHLTEIPRSIFVQLKWDY